MARIKKRGTSGQAKNFITRTQAVRKLQISLPDFRRLCIFKGIYPREPRNKKKAAKSSTASTTFYYSKDIQYLLHEPLLNKFRDHKALAKKIGRALGRGEVGDAARLERSHSSRVTLDHIIKERYPTFVDALRDLDDALSMLFLFANLPSTSTVPPKTIALCQRLCLEFEHYLIVSHTLRKSFLSIKGIYYQATIQGQDILWLVPYKFVQRVTGDVDFRIMGTFVEFYTTLLGFVNFRLYTSTGLLYPPKFDSKSDERGGELGAFTLQARDINSVPQLLDHATSVDNPAELTEATARAQALADTLTITTEDSDATAGPTLNDDPAEEESYEGDPDTANTTAIDAFTTTAADADILPQPAPLENETAALFAPFTFYLSRETPRQPLELLLKAFGCRRVGWDAVLGDGAFTGNELDPAITHQIVDRPPQPPQSTIPENDKAIPEAEGEQRQVPRGRVPGRTYVQPQWVWDCVNGVKLLRPDLYAPGATLPPHLSPWVKPTRGAYDPTAPLETETDDEEEAVIGKDESVVQGVESVKAIADLNGTEGGMDVDLNSDSEENEEGDADQDEEEEDDSNSEHNNEASHPSHHAPAAAKDDFDGFSSEDDELRTHRSELLAEAAGLPLPAPQPASVMAAQKRRKAVDRTKREKAEELERQQMMMPRRKRKLLGKMLYSNARKDEEAQRLRTKRQKLGRE